MTDRVFGILGGRVMAQEGWGNGSVASFESAPVDGTVFLSTPNL
ncbi:hypothetical protein [Streptomyces sp. KL116D]